MKSNHWRALSALLLIALALSTDLAGALTIACLAAALFVPQLNED